MGRKRNGKRYRGSREGESANFRFFVKLSVFRVPKPILEQNELESLRILLETKKTMDLATKMGAAARSSDGYFFRNAFYFSMTRNKKTKFIISKNGTFDEKVAMYKVSYCAKTLLYS